MEVIRGGVYKRKWDNSLWVLSHLGKPTDEAGQFVNHLLVRLGKKGHILVANDKNLIGAHVESFSDRFELVGHYDFMERHFHLRGRLK